MTDWSTLHDRLVTVGETPKPFRNWVWYVDRTIKTCVGITIVYVILAVIL